jgi:hypothetical protein
VLPAFRVSPKKLLNDFTEITSSQRLFKGICEMNLIWRNKIKNLMTTRALEVKFSFSYKYTLTYCYATCNLKLV